MKAPTMNIAPSASTVVEGAEDMDAAPTDAKRNNKKSSSTKKALSSLPNKRKRPSSKHTSQQRQRGSNCNSTTSKADLPSSSSSPSTSASAVPVRPLSAYNFFFRDERSAWLAEREAKKERTSDVFCSMGKEIGARWKALSEERVAYYMKLAKEDSERYKRERKLYIQRETKQAWKDFEAKQENPTVSAPTSEQSSEESAHHSSDSVSEMAVTGDQGDSERTAACSSQQHSRPQPALAGLKTLSELAVEGQGGSPSFLSQGSGCMSGAYPFAAAQPMRVPLYPMHNNPFLQDPDPYLVQQGIVSSLVRDNMMLRHILAQQQQLPGFHLPMHTAATTFPVHTAAPSCFQAIPVPSPTLAGGSPFHPQWFQSQVPPETAANPSQPPLGVRYVLHHPAAATAVSPTALSPSLVALPPTQFPILSQLSASDIAYLMQKYHQDDSTSSRQQQQPKHQQSREDDESDQVASAPRNHQTDSEHDDSDGSTVY